MAALRAGRQPGHLMGDGRVSPPRLMASNSWPPGRHLLVTAVEVPFQFTFQRIRGGAGRRRARRAVFIGVPSLVRPMAPNWLRRRGAPTPTVPFSPLALSTPQLIPE